MDKGLLYEPLVEARENYDEYFKKQEGVIGKEDEVRFRKQYEILNEIIGILDNSPEKKDKLIELFEKMQELGSPPEGIASTASFMWFISVLIAYTKYVWHLILLAKVYYIIILDLDSESEHNTQVWINWFNF